MLAIIKQYLSVIRTLFKNEQKPLENNIVSLYDRIKKKQKHVNPALTLSQRLTLRQPFNYPSAGYLIEALKTIATKMQMSTVLTPGEWYMRHLRQLPEVTTLDEYLLYQTRMVMTDIEFCNELEPLLETIIKFYNDTNDSSLSLRSKQLHYDRFLRPMISDIYHVIVLLESTKIR